MLLLIKKSKIKIFFLKKGGGGGGASEIRQTWGGACPKRLKTPGLDQDRASLTVVTFTFKGL